MDGPAHYRKAEEILRRCEEADENWAAMWGELNVGMATAHAALAQAAATIDAATFDRTTWTDRDGRDWTGAELPESWRTVLQ